MENENRRVPGTLIFNDNESYNAYISGNGTFNNGFRRSDGTLFCQPDFEESKVDNHESCGNGDYESKVEDSEDLFEENEEFGTEHNDSFESNVDSDENVINDLLKVAIGFGLCFIMTKAAPKLKQWWQMSVIPTIKSKYERFRRKENQTKSQYRPSSIAMANILSNTEEVYISPSPEKIDETYENYKKNATSKEAQKALIEIFILSSLLLKRINDFSKFEIVDSKLLLEKITSPKYIEGVNQILLANPQIVEEYSTVLIDILGRDIYKDGIYIPIDTNNIRSALGSANNDT